MNQQNLLHRKVGRGYQVTLPPEFRSQNHLSIGSTITMTISNDQLIIEPYYDPKTQALKRLHAIFQEIDEIEPLAENEERIQDIVNQERIAARKAKRDKSENSH